ncbi:two-component sensor histidine kinase [Fulvimarina pelagi HTCC2506]|uniref:Two-component sensor histidine kinase n=1 Tax=Fulvimarina pelagi HTCC2506 TaxID=314231 RepID=Q0G340_9HYPH|nr:two-component sensor histidine kinase [Fulvimarina pelagi HTCC2506]
MASTSWTLLVLIVAGTAQAHLLRENLRDVRTEVAVTYMRGIIGPFVDAFQADGSVPANIKRELDEVIESTGLALQIADVKIWRLDGSQIYGYKDLDLHARADSDEFQMAVNGELGSDFEDGDSFAGTADLHEIYIPLRDRDGQVIAVGEFYEDYGRVDAIAFEILSGSWAIRLAALATLVAILTFIVREAARTLQKQRSEISSNYRKRSALLLQNRNLIASAEEAHRQALKSGERLLSQIGSEIHDGPIQVLTLAALHAGFEKKEQGGAPRGENKVADLIQSALSELRRISHGLILPDIETLNTQDTVRTVVDLHQRLTGSEVRLSFKTLPEGLSPELRACMYRVIQEGLNNGYRHAGGRGQAVEVGSSAGKIEITVENDALESSSSTDAARPRLGLKGIRNRVQSFHGSADFRIVDGRAILEIELPMTRSNGDVKARQ